MKLIVFIFLGTFSLTVNAQVYSGICDAGPVKPGYNKCEPQGGTHVATAYDKALECALRNAESKCLIAGYRYCPFLTTKNHGMVASGDHSFACRVEAYVRGSN